MNVTLASVWERTSLAARGALVALALSACGQSTTDGAQTSTISDTASAYQALSERVEGCQDDKDSCVTVAAGDATKLAACDTKAEGCIGNTHGAQDDARRRLRDDAEGCVRECRKHGSDSDAGTDEGGRMDTRGCMNRRAPADSQCMDDFFTCLDATGVRQSGGMSDLDPATREAVSKCVDTAHTCMMNDMRSRRGPGHGRGPGMRGAAGEPASDAGAGGSGAGRRGRGPRAEAGDGADDQDSAGRGDRGMRGAAGAAPGRGGRRSGSGGAGGN